MHENVDHAGRMEGRARKLQSIRRHLSKLGHRVCFIVGCSKHSRVPAPSFKRMWKRTRKFIIQIPCEFMLASSADISYVVFFTDEEKRFDFCLFSVIVIYISIFVIDVFYVESQQQNLIVWCKVVTSVSKLALSLLSQENAG
jgi:hypothetical protein